VTTSVHLADIIKTSLKQLKIKFTIKKGSSIHKISYDILAIILSLRISSYVNDTYVLMLLSRLKIENKIKTYESFILRILIN
jgi:hypothetical protein